MKTRRRRTIQSGSLVALLAFVALFTAAPGASAAGGKWALNVLGPSRAQPGDTIRFVGSTENIGEATLVGSTPGHPIVVTGKLPVGLEVVGEVFAGGFTLPDLPCTVSAHEFSCDGEALQIQRHNTEGILFLRFEAKVEPDASGALTSVIEVRGGDSSEPSAIATHRLEVSPEPAPFRVEALDIQNAANPAGDALATAGGHPFNSVTTLRFSTKAGSRFLQGTGIPVEAPRDVFTALPPGFVANPSITPKCPLSALYNANPAESLPLCESETQVGTLNLMTNISNRGAQSSDIPVFNLAPPPGVPARLGFSITGVVVVLDAAVRNGGDYGVDVLSRNISTGLALAGVQLEIWGTPAGTAFDTNRACPNSPPPMQNAGPECDSDLPELAFMRLPTSCAEEVSGLPFTLRTRSWQHPEAFVSRILRTHEAPGYPLPAEPSLFPATYTGPTQWGAPQGPTGCEDVPFEPSISVRPTIRAADSPTGLEVDIELPQENIEDPEAISTSDLKDAVVTMPKGLTVNPSSASGLAACSPAQIGLITPVGDETAEFNSEPNCPSGSKIGTVDVETPLLEEHVKGSVYLAQQGQNPFGSFLAMYLVAKANGIVLTLPGKITAQADGQLVTTFSNQPQQPFSRVHLSLFGGPRAALRTPSTCGTYTAQAKLTPWSGNAPVDVTSSFEISQGCGGGFDPKFSAGTRNPLAGSYSPFTFRLSRADGNQELAGLRLAVPPGLLANLKGIPYCSDATLAAISGALGTGAAQIANPACPAASQVGTVTAGAGAGPNPFYTDTGKAYWAGPYKGAPVSLAAVVPAVAGPFDLGSVVVRNGFEVNRETARITAVADPFPTVLHGIPLDLRDVRLDLDRPNYTLNPTSCDPMSFEADITSSAGTHALRSQRFQVAGCDRLAFKPKLRLRLSGATKRSGHPALRAILTMPPGGANVASASVALPHTEFLAQNHIRTICTRVQYAADRCPKGSIYGYARAYSPILDYYLRGPVYLRSSSHPLPDLVASLGGQIEIDVVGRIDSVDGGIRSTFKGVPDAPVSKFVLEMPGGEKSLLENSVNICRREQRATALFEAQNGKVRELRPVLRAACKGKPKKRRYG